MDWRELLAAIWEGVEAGLLREEELLMAEAGVTVRGIEVMMKCFDDMRPKERWGEGIRGRVARASPLRCSSEERAERLGELIAVSIGKALVDGCYNDMVLGSKRQLMGAGPGGGRARRYRRPLQAGWCRGVCLLEHGRIWTRQTAGRGGSCAPQARNNAGGQLDGQDGRCAG